MPLYRFVVAAYVVREDRIRLFPVLAPTATDAIDTLLRPAALTPRVEHKYCTAWREDEWNSLNTELVAAHAIVAADPPPDCQCRFSDPWRCLQHQIGRGRPAGGDVVCHCPCHQNRTAQL